MITKLPYILVLFSIGCFFQPHTVLAQDEGYPMNHFQEPSYQELNLNEDKSLLFEPAENRPMRTIQSLQRDSIAINSGKAKTAKKPASDKKEEDALSFNFLYYIIQKYKISDIVDQ